MRVNYRPGTWTALIREGALLVLPADADAVLIADLWAGLGDVRELGALVDLLTVNSGGSFAGLPDFAAVVLDGADARIAVRGMPEIVVEGAEGQIRISGVEVSTWHERLLRGVSRIDVLVEGATGGELPILGGVVRIGGIAIETAGSDAARAVSAMPAPTRADAAPAASPAAAGTPVSAEPPVIADPPVAAAPPVAVSVVVPVIAPLPPSVPSPVADADSPSSGGPVAADAVNDEVSADTIMPADIPDVDEVDEFDMLWGETVHRPAGGGDTANAQPEAEDFAIEGDHDGATISLAEARALRQSANSASPEAPTVAIPVVSGGRIRVSTGQVVALDRTVIIGRRPRSTRASGANLPHLIAVESPEQDISRSHLEIRPEGDTILAIDLHTTNGSTLLRPGAEPVRLHPGEQTLVLSGDVVDLGDGVTVLFEDLP